VSSFLCRPDAGFLGRRQRHRVTRATPGSRRAALRICQRLTANPGAGGPGLRPIPGPERGTQGGPRPPAGPAALILKSAEGADVGCGERSEPHQTRRAEAMRFVPHRILRRCSVAHGRRYDQGRPSKVPSPTGTTPMTAPGTMPQPFDLVPLRFPFSNVERATRSVAVLVIHFGTPCPKMTALGDSLFVPRFALRPWRCADISRARCRLRTTPSNGLTACRMRLHMASAYRRLRALASLSMARSG